MATLVKTYDCLQCKAPIKLEKRAEGGWNKFNLDGTAHTHPIKARGYQQQQDTADEVRELKAQIKSLVTQVQLLRRQFSEAFGTTVGESKQD